MRNSRFFRCLLITFQMFALLLIILPIPPVQALTGYTVTYDGNGNTSGDVPVDPTLYAEGEEISISDNTGNLQKSGLVFVGWTQIADGTEILKPGESLVVETSDIVLYAKWEPALIVNYNFDNQLIDQLGNSVLIPFSTASDGYNRNNATSGFGNDDDGSYWYWTSSLSRGGGFKIDIDQAISTSYTIGVRFSFASTGSGYRKIIDYKNSASDTGFYFLGGRLNFYPYGTGTTSVANNQVVDIIATRKADGLFTAYFVINGTLYKELELNAGNEAIPSIVDGKVRFGFFFDDIATGSEATSGGKVYSVRVWNGPISSAQAETAMEPTYTVSFDTDSDTTIATQTIKKDEKAAQPADPIKIGHAFLGWYYHVGQGWMEFDFDTPITQNVELKALWQPNQYTVRFVDHEGELISESLVNHEEIVTEPTDPTRIGHTFLGWYYHVGQGWMEFDFDTPITQNIELKALWQPNQYTVRFVDHDGTLITETFVNHEEPIIEPSDPSRDNHTFLGWINHDGSGWVEFDFDTLITQNMELKAFWTLNQYMVRFVDHEGELISESLVVHGEDAIAPVHPSREGWVFNGWDLSLTSITSPRTIQATYKSAINSIVEDSGAEDLQADVTNLDQAVSFTEEELNELVLIRLIIKRLESDGVSLVDLGLINEYLATLGTDSTFSVILLDISLFKEIGTDISAIFESLEPITIKLKVPENLQGKKFKLIRIHDGILQELSYLLYDETNTITFNTDKFSTYALVLGEQTEQDPPLPDARDHHSSGWLILLIGICLLLVSNNKKYWLSIK